MNPEARIRKLRQYLPFLQRRQEHLSSRGEIGESDKLKSLIGVLTKNVGELSPSTLERCEAVCKDMYLKFGRPEDDVKPNIHEIRDPRLIPHERVISPQEETPRSPSPEHAPMHQSFAPKTIPERRTDTDMRMPIAVMKSERPDHPPAPPPSSSNRHQQREDRDYRQWNQGPSSRGPSRFDRYTPLPRWPNDQQQQQPSPTWHDQPPSSWQEQQPPNWQDQPPQQPWSKPPSRWDPPGAGPYERPPFSPSTFYRPRWSSGGEGGQYQRRPEPPRPPPRHDTRGHSSVSRPVRPRSPPRDPRFNSKRPSARPQRPSERPQHSASNQKKPLLASPDPSVATNKVVTAPAPQSRSGEVAQVVDESKKEKREEETKETRKEAFTSPLGGLYDDVPRSSQTGKGYGVQKFKIPKKKKNKEENNKKLDSKVVRDSSSSESDEKALVIAETREDTETVGEPEKVAETLKETDSEGNELPLELVESFLKRNLPPPDVESVLERLKSKPSNEPAIEGDAVVSSTSENEPVLQVADTSENERSVDSEPSTTGRKRNAGRKKGSGELARLKEDLTDLLKGPVDPGGRRTRAKTNPEPSRTEETTVVVQRSETRGRKRKTTAPEIQQQQETRNDEKKPRKDEAKVNKDFVQCKECSYLGQDIVHHYVNEHGSVEVPYVALAKETLAQCDRIVDLKLDEVDVSWIPSEFTSAVLCNQCNSYSTTNKSELVEHVISHSLSNSVFTCAICPVAMKDFFELLDHLGSHTGEYRHRCNYCDLKCNSRTTMKSHVASLHGDNQSNYSTDVVDPKTLPVYGFACTECHFYQMNEDRLKRHVEMRDKCKEYVKFSLFSVENRRGSIKDGVFECASLEVASRSDEMTDNELTERLKVDQAAWIQHLAEKLEQKADVNKATVTPSSVTKEKQEKKVVKQSTPCKNETMDASVVEMNDSVVAVDVVETPTEKKVAVVVESWRRNSWLETTISKLADKLGGAVVVEPNPLSVSLVQEDDGDEDMDVDEESSEVEDEEESESDESSEEQTKTPEASLAAFLKIEGVMSLNDDDDDVECIDPLDDVIIYSNVVLPRDEVTFPYALDHNRPELVLKLKTPDTYKRMTERSRLISFFKCLAFKCFFTCDDHTDFLTHLKWHSKLYAMPKTKEIPVHRFHQSADATTTTTTSTLTFPDFLLCSYCPFGAKTPGELVDHVQSLHRDCQHQCSVCVFRGWKPKAVALHILTSHRAMSAPVLACPRIKQENDIQISRFSSLKEAPSYRCFAEKCKFVCFTKNSLTDHLLTHSTPLKCPDCLELVDAGQDFTGIFNHLSEKHSIGRLQCTFCNYGTEKSGDAVIHHCLKHPWLDGRFLVRNNDLASSAGTMAALGRPEYSLNVKIDFNYNYKELLYFVKYEASRLTKEEDVPEVEQEEEEEVVEIDEKKEEQVVDERKDETNKLEETNDCIVIESDEEEDKGKRVEPEMTGTETGSNGNGEESTEKVKEAKDVADDEDEEQVQDGLYGRQLYVCANIGCDETAETSAAFKDHLLICDLARDSRLLTCRHCGKNAKQVANLMEHLRVHGIKRYHCALCNYRSHISGQVRKHLKTLHKIATIDEVPIGHGPGPAISENALVAFYPRDLVAKLKLRPRQSSASSARNSKSKTYTCNETASIPKKSIFLNAIRCAHCGYSSKIRTNIVRHLSLHRSTDHSAPSSENEEIVPKIMIPHQDPVNPVPLVENPSKGRMFDKMANLAGSSHEPTNGKEKDTSQLPVFVPDHQRFVCGYEECSHLTISDNMLRIHLSTLHKSGLFRCRHCAANKDEDDGLMSMEAYRSHLKMHGPRLYKCGHCAFYHWQLNEVDGHLVEKHPNRPPWRYIIREPDDKEVQKHQTAKANGNDTRNVNSAQWACNLCKFSAASLAEMHSHADTVHAVKSQYKCAICPVRCNVRSEFERHFNNKHPNHEVQVLTLFYKKEDELKEAVKVDDPVMEQPEPLWKKNEYRMRHIRGILLDENELIEIMDDGEDGSTGQTVTVKVDPKFGPYGSALNGQLVCPKCNTYRVAYGRDMKVHLYKELEYKKYLCSICNEGCTSRALCLKHIEKTHPTQGGFIREISYDAALENWVDQVIKHQTDALKSIRLNNQPPKQKKTVPPATTNATPAPTSPTKSPVKAKKQVTPATVGSSSSASSSNFVCLACRFAAESQAALEDHVRASHATSTGFVCVECGFRATTTLAIANHQNRTQHSRTLESPPEVKKEPVDPDEAPTTSTTTPATTTTTTTTTVAPPQQKKPKEKAAKTPAYQCQHCAYTSTTEHAMNVHWQSKHSAAKLPLEFATGSRTLIYRCQYCPAQPAQYDTMLEHSTVLHPDLPAKLFRVTQAKTKRPDDTTLSAPSKKIKEEKVDDDNDDGDDGETMQLNSSVTISLSPAKKVKTGPTVKEPVPAVTITPRPSLEPPQLTPAPVAPANNTTAGSSNNKTVYVVAPPQQQVKKDQPTYSCVWCQLKFNHEAQVIRHHSSHSDQVPLRYTCFDPLKTNPSSGKPELTFMEIRFDCPVCTKSFMSLGLATRHVHEHKQAWKCGHCVKLFLSPVDALQHMKDAHPGVQGRLESIDSPKEVFDRLSRGINCTRFHFKAPGGQETKEVGKATSVTTPPPPPPKLTQAVAKKSTTTNLFLNAPGCSTSH